MNNQEVWIRTCQSCGYKQEAKNPATYKDVKAEAWRDVKCKRCKSVDLDYGSVKQEEDTE